MDEAAPGEEVVFTAVPDAGRRFTQFKIFDPNREIDLSQFRLYETGNADEYAFIMIDRDLIVDCVFE